LPSAAASLASAVPALVHALDISFGGLVYLAAGGPYSLVWLAIAIIICLAAPNVADWLSPWQLALDRPADKRDRDGALRWVPGLGWGIAIGMLLAFCVAYQQSTMQFLYFQF
jgi:hypothetical protein